MLGWVWGVPIHALEADLGVGLSLARDSNIARVNTGAQSDVTEAVLAGFAASEHTADVTARLLAQVERRHFRSHTFGDDTGGYLEGAMLWVISPRRLTWTVEDVFREVQVNVTDPSTPSNFAKSNALSTGPDFTLLFSSTNSANIGGRYGRFDIQNSTTDNRRATGYVRVLHTVSPRTTLSLNYELARTYFEPGAQLYSKVLREDLYARYDTRSGPSGVALDVGTARIKREGGPDLTGLRLVRLSLTEALSSQSSVQVTGSDQVSDTYSDLIAGVAGSAAPRDTGVAVVNGTPFSSGDLYRSRRGDLAYVFDDGRFAYTLQGYARRVDFVVLDQDYQEGGGRFALTWTASGALQFNANVDYLRRTFPTLDREDTDRAFGAGAAFRLNRNVTVSVRADRTRRESTVAESSFEDNRVFLLLGYSTGPLYQVQSRR